MTDVCCCPPEAGSVVCDLPLPATQRPPRITSQCPVCNQVGKSVQGQTVKAMLSVSLREVREGDYLFCRTQTCPVVYFSLDGSRTFTTQQVRDRVYQKELDIAEVFVCYCFRHTIGDLKAASPETRIAILDDINTGIQVGQCACDLRNPQGSCCLGNVRILLKRLEHLTILTT